MILRLRRNYEAITIILGNPGVGKSTIHNTLLGKVSSPSGSKLGSSATKFIKKSRQGDFICIDTPGLVDVGKTHRSFNEVARAFRGPALIRLVFVCTLESGRVREADVTTLATISDSFRRVIGNAKLNVLVIINKCHTKIYDRLKQASLPDRALVLSLFRAFVEINEVAFIRYEERVADRSNRLLKNVNVLRLRNVIEKLPTVRIQENTRVRLNVDDYRRNRTLLDVEVDNFHTAYTNMLRTTNFGNNVTFNANSCATQGLDVLNPSDLGERVGLRVKRILQKIIEFPKRAEPWVPFIQALCGIIVIFL